jgi:hypothetical protein
MRRSVVRSMRGVGGVVTELSDLPCIQKTGAFVSSLNAKTSEIRAGGTGYVQNCF